MPSSTQEIGPVRGRSHYREVHCQVLLHQLSAQVCLEAPGVYVHQERMLSQPVTREDGRDMAGGTHVKNVLPAGEAGLVFYKLSVLMLYQDPGIF